MMTLRRKREAGEEPTEPKLVERLQDMYLVIMIIKIIIILYLNIIMMYLLIVTYMSIDVRIILSAATKYYGNDDDVQWSSFVEARV